MFGGGPLKLLTVTRATVHGGQRHQEGSGVRMGRRLTQGRAGRHLNDLAGVHDGDPIGRFEQQGEVVRDEHDGDAHAVADLQHLVDDLSLRDDIERGGGLVQQQHVGFEG